MCQHAHVCMPEGFPSLHSFLSPSLIINTIFFKDDALMLISGLTKATPITPTQQLMAYY